MCRLRRRFKIISEGNTITFNSQLSTLNSVLAPLNNSLASKTRKRMTGLVIRFIFAHSQPVSSDSALRLRVSRPCTVFCTSAPS